MAQQIIPITGGLGFNGSVAGSVTLQAQSYAGNSVLLLPNVSALTGQILTAVAVNGSNVTLGWATPVTQSVAGGNAVLLFPTAVAVAGQALTAVVVNGSNVTLGWAVPLAAAPNLVIFLPGVGSNNQICLYMVLKRAVTFPAGVGSPPLVSGSSAVASVAATASTTYTLKRNGSAFATVVFAIGGTTGTFTQASSASFNGSTDILEIDGPATADATLANVGFTFVGN
jgi:hypothetical protein